jgi:hypothetical protein
VGRRDRDAVEIHGVIRGVEALRDAFPRLPVVEGAEQPPDLDTGVGFRGVARIDGDPGDALRRRPGMDGDIREGHVDREPIPAQAAIA